jgi:hypothetical protein
MTKTQVPLDADLWKRVRRVASNTGRPPEEVLEAAVRRYLIDPADILDLLRPPDNLSDEGAMQLAYDEIHKIEG